MFHVQRRHVGSRTAGARRRPIELTETGKKNMKMLDFSVYMETKKIFECSMHRIVQHISKNLTSAINANYTNSPFLIYNLFSSVPGQTKDIICQTWLDCGMQL